MEFKELDLLKIGNTIGIAGIILSGESKQYVLNIPDSLEDPQIIETLDLSLDEWKTLLRQMDLVETEVLADDPSGMKKVIIRKTARIIDQKVSWKVYERDKYTCRYCGRTGIPLTVDHLVLWEEGGPSIEENLLTSCRQCNKARGNTQYDEWLESDFYQRVSKGLPAVIQLMNKSIIPTLAGIPRKLHKPSRGKKKKK